MKLLDFVLFGLLVLPAQSFAASHPDPSPPDSVGTYLSYDGPRSERAVDARKREVEASSIPPDANCSGVFSISAGLTKPFQTSSWRNARKMQHGRDPARNSTEAGGRGAGAGLDEDLRRADSSFQRARVRPRPAFDCTAGARQFSLGQGVSTRARDGRVLAHELFHVFRKTVKHGREGVAKTSFSRRDLISDRFKFDVKDTALVESH